MRALLVVNHQATTTSERSRDVLIRALGSAVTLDVVHTRCRGHATSLVRSAGTGVDLVVAHGGDGTVNEVTNGLLATGSDAASRPALAVVPGGSTNVFARALGLPRDWAEAAGVLLEAVAAGRTRTIGLGRATTAGPAGAGERHFLFCAGLGIDAAVIRRVERARRKGRGSTPARYARATIGQLLSGTLSGRHRRPAITAARPATGPPAAEQPDAEQPETERLGCVIVQNTAPWTFLGDRPVDPNPDASFDHGLDVLALRALNVPTAARTFGQMLTQRTVPHGRQVVRWQDLSALSLRADPPQPFQVDGDYLGECHSVELQAVPQAVRVYC